MTNGLRPGMIRTVPSVVCSCREVVWSEEPYFLTPYLIMMLKDLMQRRYYRYGRYFGICSWRGRRDSQLRGIRSWLFGAAGSADQRGSSLAATTDIHSWQTSRVSASRYQGCILVTFHRKLRLAMADSLSNRSPLFKCPRWSFLLSPTNPDRVLEL